MPKRVAFPHRDEIELLKAAIGPAVMKSMRRAAVSVLIVDAVVYGVGWAI